MIYNIKTPLNSNDVANINNIIDQLKGLDMIQTELHKVADMVSLCFESPVHTLLPLTLTDVRIYTCIINADKKYTTISF